MLFLDCFFIFILFSTTIHIVGMCWLTIIFVVFVLSRLIDLTPRTVFMTSEKSLANSLFFTFYFTSIDILICLRNDSSIPFLICNSLSVNYLSFNSLKSSLNSKRLFLTLNILFFVSCLSILSQNFNF